jgi:hypothetical protein
MDLQFGPELDAFRDLVFGQPLLAQPSDFLLGGLLAVLQDDESLDESLQRLLLVLVGNTHHGGLQHLGVLVQHLFHITGINVVLTSKDHVLLAVNIQFHGCASQSLFIPRAAG